METFINILADIKPTIITGWNVDRFDIPYLIRRIIKIRSKHDAFKLSPINKIEWSDFRNKFFIAGINVIDYLEIYKKFSYVEEQNYRLDTIAKKELGYGKIEFDGTSTELYKQDINKFIEYNINDTKLVYEIDKKRKLLDLIIGIAHKGRIKYEDISFPSRYLEGAILCFLKHKNLVSPNKPAKTGTRDKFSGAFVKIPQLGLKEWLFDLDLTSLYPSIIMSLNISPDTKVGKIQNWDNHKFYSGEIENIQLYSFELNKTVSIKLLDFKEFMKDSKYTISSNGILYKNVSELDGVIPSILRKWFDERVEYKNMMKKFGNSKSVEKYEYYAGLQNIQKVLLNSLYGVLGLPVFRYYDLDNAEAVTTTGVEIIKNSEVFANEFMNKELNTKDVDYCVYIDTDSVSGESLIRTKQFGNIAIEDLFSKLIETNQLNNMNFSKDRQYIFPKDLTAPYFDEKLNKVRNGNVEFIEKHKVKKQQFKLKFKSNKYVNVTKDHSCVILKNKKLIKTAAEELKIGDECILLRSNGHEVVPILEIIDLGIIDGYVYDLGMGESPHTFFANNILVHNSLFLSAAGYVKNILECDIVDKIKDVTTKTQQYINKKYNTFSKNRFNIDKHRFEIKQELICKSGFWTAKKRYALWVIDKEGMKVNELFVRGIDVVRSSFPPAFVGIVNELLTDILNGIDHKTISNKILEFESNLDSVSILDISRNTTVNNIVKYTRNDDYIYYKHNTVLANAIKSTPAHVKAAIGYNDLLRYYKLPTKYTPIESKEKIKWCYLKNNQFGLESIGFRGHNDPQIIMDFIEKNIDRNKIYERELKTKIESIFGSIGIVYPSTSTLIFDTFFS